jgi:hypothetical protein
MQCTVNAPQEEVQHFYKNADRNKVEIVYLLKAKGINSFAKSKFSKHFAGERNLNCMFSIRFTRMLK